MRSALIAQLSSQSLASAIDANFLREARMFFRDSFKALLEASVRRHPLGFVYAAEQVTEGVFLRYHFWPSDWSMPSLEEGREDHDHTYELSSLVILGSLKHQTFSATESDLGSLQIFDVSYERGDSTLRATGRRVLVQELQCQLYRAGQCYRLPPGTIHRATPIARPLATLVLTREGASKSKPRVLGSVGGIAPVAFHRRELNPTEIEQYRGVLIEAFDSM